MPRFNLTYYGEVFASADNLNTLVEVGNELMRSFNMKLIVKDTKAVPGSYCQWGLSLDPPFVIPIAKMKLKPCLTCPNEQVFDIIRDF